MEKFIYDGSMELDATTEYCFICEDLDHAKNVFFNLCEEDMDNFAEERAVADEYEITGCIIILEMNNETEVAENIYISVQVEVDDELYELEPTDIELDEEAIGVLLSKVNEE